MSLINQMLQDIERRESRPQSRALLPEAPGPQHYSAANASAPHAWRQGWPGLLALAALAALAGGAAAWRLAGQPPVIAVTTAALPPVAQSLPPAALVAVPVAAPPPVAADIPALAPPAPPRPAALVAAAPAPGVVAREVREPAAPASKPAAPAIPSTVASRAQTPASRPPANAVPAATAVAARAEQLYQQALAESRQSQPELALKSLREALESQPGHVQARLALARLLVDRKQADAAADLLADGLMLLPQQSGFALALAPLWFQSGRQDEAMGLLAQNAKSAGNAPDYHAYYAAQLLRLQRHAEAARQYSIALGGNPGMVDWLIGLGLSLQGNRNDKDALEAFKRAYDTGSLTGQKRELVEQMIAGLKTRLGL